MGIGGSVFVFFVVSFEEVMVYVEFIKCNGSEFIV